MTTRVSSKRQITIPAALCRELDIAPGQAIDVTAVGDAIVLRKKPAGEEDFRAMLAAIDYPPLVKGTDLEYIRRIRDGGDLGELDGLT